MWPERRPCRGSGSLPAKRPAARASRHLFAPAFQIGLQLVAVAQQEGVGAGGEVPLPGSFAAALHGAALGHPLRQPAVQHRHVAVPEVAKGPPDPRRAPDAALVVDQVAQTVAQPELADLGGELHRRGQHVGQRAVAVGDIVDVEEHGPGDVVLLVLVARVQALRLAGSSWHR